MHLPAHRRLVRCLAVGIAGLVLAACGKPSLGVATAVEPDSPCRLLTNAEVSAVFANVKAGERNRSREEYGIAACQWSGDHGDFSVETWKAGESSADNEIRGLAAGFVDPLNPKAAGNVRYEPIDGVGEQAFAVIETKDQQRGILTDVALLVARRGDKFLALASTELVRRDRGAALQALTTLGRAAAPRL